MNFDKNFSLMVKMATLHLLFGLEAIVDMELIQMDFKVAFLHANLDDDVYMKQTEGFVIKSNKGPRTSL